jgi:hypothetical protein
MKNNKQGWVSRPSLIRFKIAFIYFWTVEPKSIGASTINSGLESLAVFPTDADEPLALDLGLVLSWEAEFSLDTQQLPPAFSADSFMYGQELDSVVIVLASPVLAVAASLAPAWQEPPTWLISALWLSAPAWDAPAPVLPSQAYKFPAAQTKASPTNAIRDFLTGSSLVANDCHNLYQEQSNYVSLFLMSIFFPFSKDYYIFIKSLPFGIPRFL